MADAERLQKIIAAAGVVSRRKAEALIQQGRVTVNGQVVTELGSKADPLRDHIKVDGKLIHSIPKKIYVLVNKPKGVVSSNSDPINRTRVIDLLPLKTRVYPVGRLDFNTEGLILLTNDGAFSKIVASAGEHMPKVYRVKVRSVPEEDDLERLRRGIVLRGGVKLGRCKIKPLQEENNSWYEVTLYEGKNRQIREMFAAIGHPVSKLRRVKIGFLTDRGLPVGAFRHLTENEVARVLRIGERGRGSDGHEEARSVYRNN